jgi:hypothetical protein
VTVHGASVIYRKKNLVQAFQGLQGRVWLNDDVVVPLSLRLADPAGVIEYLRGNGREGWVRDLGLRAEVDVEFRRRRRMVVGNLQWIRGLLLPRLLENPMVTLIASRRVFRLLWAYWVLLVGLGLIASWEAASLPHAYLALPLVFFAVQFVRSNWLRRLSMAFVTGLGIPRYWQQMGWEGLGSRKGVSWV